MSEMKIYWQFWCWKLALALLVIGAVAHSLNRVMAQNITIDGTLGPARQLTGPNYSILQSDGRVVGRNLFHSFGKFNLNTGEKVIFYSDPTISNILSRVTGARSSIDGRIQAYSDTVNLFLLNPSGISFGPNASLNVGNVTRGSFVATTVDALLWPNGGQFSATHPGGTDSLLRLVGDPSGFLSSLKPPPIATLASNLQVYSGQSLLLVGGDVSLNGGRLLAPGGRVELAGVAGAGIVGLNIAGNALSLSVPSSLARADVSLTNGAEVNVRAGGGGSIAIDAQNLNLAGGSKLRAGIASGPGSSDRKAGDIDIQVNGSVNLADGSFIANVVQLDAKGKGGDINIQADSVSLVDGSKLIASTFGEGDAGSVNINARNTVSFAGEYQDPNFPPSASGGAYSRVETGAKGNGGNVNITTGSLSVTEGAVLSTSIDGQGNAGNVNIFARDGVSFAGEGIDGKSSGAFSAVKEKDIGQGGNINVTTRVLSVTDGAALIASTLGFGNAGSVNINASNTVFFVGEGADHFSSGAYSNVEKTGVGQGGSVNVNTGALYVTDGAALEANTLGQGNAGSVNINVRDTALFAGEGADFFSSGAYSRVETDAKGNGGNVNITTGSLSLIEGAVLSTSMAGQGKAGDVNVNVRDAVSLDGQSSPRGVLRQSSGAFSVVQANGIGQGGDINVTTGSLSVTNGAALIASTLGSGNAGNVTINARDRVFFDGIGADSFSSGAYSRVEFEANGHAGNIEVTTGSLSLTHGAVLTSSTNGQGNAGSVNINVRNTALFDGEGNSINPDVGLRQYSGAFSSVKQYGVGQGGSVNVTAGSLSLTNGAELITNTFGHGDAGTVKIQVDGLITVDGVGSSFSSGADSEVAKDAVGQGGDISVTTGSLSVTNGAQLSASTFGQGKGGNIQVNAAQSVKLAGAGSSLSVSSIGQGSGAAGDIQLTTHSIQLDNQGQIIAETDSGQGGNIQLHDLDLLLMRYGSEISTTAGKQNANGDGGNITIDTPFIVAVPQENSDITANAYTGKGGRVDITAQGIFGTQFRPHLTALSDITASSQFGVNGTVQINTPGVDPSRGLANLPVTPVDASRQIAQGCPAGVGPRASKFVVTGRGGLPPTPQEATRSELPLADLGTSISYRGNRVAVTVSGSPNSPTAIPIVEAQGWVINSKGEVELTAEAPTVNPHSPWLTTTACHAL